MTGVGSGEHDMLYRKNLHAKEQLVRIGIGVTIGVAGLILIHGWISFAIAGLGAFIGLTGVFGFCPGCAMVGRKLDRQAASQATRQ